MPDISKSTLLPDCRLCNLKDTKQYFLLETEYFSVICDPHPVVEGHLLIVPKQHMPCIAEYDDGLYAKFLPLYQRMVNFIRGSYGSVATFEHGKYGQTIFHSHVHILPMAGSPVDVVPEGPDTCTPLVTLDTLKDLNTRHGGYLFFSIEDKMWAVNHTLATPRFFRDRFASAVGHPERGDWKQMTANPATMQLARQENLHTLDLWLKWQKRSE